MIKVLVLDDRFGSRMNICEIMDNSFSNRIKVTACRDILEANAALENDEYDVIIVDCMLSTLGLDEEQIKYAKEGLLTGVVWLCGVYKSKPEKLKNTLLYVFSGFIDAMDKYIEDLKEYANNDSFFGGLVSFYSKGGNNIDEMIKDIREKLNI